MDIPLEGNPYLLNVTGYIGTEERAYEIKINRRARYVSIFDDFPKRETEVIVLIKESQGNSVFLKEVSPGTYVTPGNFKAEEGESYTLLIPTVNGKEYISTSQLVPSSVAIENVSYEYREISSEDQEKANSGFSLFITFRDNEDESNYFSFSAEGFYTSSTRPYLHLLRPPGQPVPIPAPKESCYKCFAKGEILADLVLE